MHQVHTGRGPSYLSNLVTYRLVKPFDQQAANATKSQERNLSSRSQDRLHGTLLTQFDSKTFKKLLKTFLFTAAYD